MEHDDFAVPAQDLIGLDTLGSFTRARRRVARVASMSLLRMLMMLHVGRKTRTSSTMHNEFQKATPAMCIKEG